MMVPSYVSLKVVPARNGEQSGAVEVRDALSTSSSSVGRGEKLCSVFHKVLSDYYTNMWTKKVQLIETMCFLCFKRCGLFM